MPVLPDQALEDPNNTVGQNDQHYKLYDEIRGMKVEWHDHKIALLGVVSMSVAIRVQHVGFDAGPPGTIWPERGGDQPVNAQRGVTCRRLLPVRCSWWRDADLQ